VVGDHRIPGKRLQPLLDGDVQAPGPGPRAAFALILCNSLTPVLFSNPCPVRPNDGAAENRSTVASDSAKASWTKSTLAFVVAARRRFGWTDFRFTDSIYTRKRFPGERKFVRVIS